MSTSIEEKVDRVNELAALWADSHIDITHPLSIVSIPEPGRPERPILIEARALPARKLNSPEGHQAFIHALAHIEFNAINLALDAIYRFDHLPEQYYADWIQVAKEEALHFGLLDAHLHRIGSSYGSFPGHNGLWEMAVKTESSLLLRMALVPRVLEARGLDVSPGMISRLEDCGDLEGAEILTRILKDEIGHVAIGNRWYHWACAQGNKDALAVFQALLDEYMPGKVRGPLHREARRMAGFTEREMDWMEAR